MISKNCRTLVIGLGEIGFHNCEYMANMGLMVDGHDISENAIQRALDAGVIQQEANDFKNYDCYMVCVSTHNPENMESPSLDSFFDVIKRISINGKQGSLVAIESTIPMGTSKTVNSILEHRFHIVHAPHRFYKKEKNVHGINQLRVLGGCQSCCVESGLYFYENLLDIPMHVVDEVETAELTKIIENTYRMIQIAFAEELKLFCDSSNIDFEQLKTAINTKWNINILDALNGVNGHCLPKDSQMYLTLLNNTVPLSIAASAKKIDEIYKQNIALAPKRDSKITPRITF